MPASKRNFYPVHRTYGTFAPSMRGLICRRGAPTSPALANVCSYRLDCRLAGLALAAGAAYTRYADDLAFSGGERFDRSVDRFAIYVARIVREEGFTPNHRKTRIMRQSVRQHLAGLVINQQLNLRRKDYDVLKAILTNCIRHGPANQNREAHPHFREHLAGRVSFVESIHPGKGGRLRKLFDKIDWPGDIGNILDNPASRVYPPPQIVSNVSINGYGSEMRLHALLRFEIAPAPFPNPFRRSAR